MIDIYALKRALLVVGLTILILVLFVGIIFFFVGIVSPLLGPWISYSILGILFLCALVIFEYYSMKR